MATSTSLIQDYITRLNADRDAQITEIKNIFGKAEGMYAADGSMAKALEASLARGGRKAVATGAQQLAQSGLGGSTVAGGLAKKYEEEVGAPARLQGEATRAQALANLMVGKAGAISNIKGSAHGIESQLTGQLANIYARDNTPTAPRFATPSGGRFTSSMTPRFSTTPTAQPGTPATPSGPVSWAAQRKLQAAQLYGSSSYSTAKNTYSPSSTVADPNTIAGTMTRNGMTSVFTEGGSTYDMGNVSNPQSLVGTLYNR